MSVTVKICGLRTPETLVAALDAGADYIGMVDFPRSPRHLEPAAMQPLAAIARGRAKIVVLTVDATPERLATLVETVRPDVLQLHGSETPEQVAAIRARHGIPVMKVIRVATSADVATARPYRAVADLLMFDAKAPASPQPGGTASLPGGTGHSFDWRLLAGVAAEGPFMLAGGLNAGNVAEAMAVTGAPMLDLSSGVETAPGVKSIPLIHEFMAAVRAAAASRIRDVADHEIAQVAAVHRSAILAVGQYSEAERQSWAAGLTVDGYRSGLAEGARIRLAMGGTGTAAAFCITKGPELRALYVHPTSQSSGIGSALLRDGESIIRNNGHDSFQLTASMNAVPFYEAHGWIVVELVQHQTRGGLMLPAARMVKTPEGHV